jgi:hypothetical protein
MPMDLFANRVHDVQLLNGVVRIEFCVAGRNESGEFTPDAPIKPEDVHFTVNLPMSGFGRSLGVLRKFAQELREKGLMRKPEEGGSQEDMRARSRRKQASLVDITAEEADEDGSS